MVTSGQSSALIFVPPRWSCRLTRKPCLCHPRLRRGTQHLPHTPRCDTHQVPALVLGEVELPRNPLLCFGGPCGLGEPPADVRTIRLCSPRWPAFPVGPGRLSQLGQSFRLNDSLGLSKIQSNSTWLMLISSDICLNNWPF